jgi:hypothetical protein
MHKPRRARSQPLVRPVRVSTFAIIPILLGYLYLPISWPHVSISLPLQQGFGFCANLVRTACSLPGHLAWLPTLVEERAVRVPPFRASTLRDFRPVLYAGFRIECRLVLIGKPSRKPFPFGPASAFWTIASLGRVSLTTPHHTFTCVDHSRSLNGVTASGSRLIAFSSSLPTFDDQSPAVGRCSHPGTWGGRS